MATREKVNEWSDGEYPTDAALERIERWDGNLRELMQFVRSIWWAADWGWHEEGDDFYVSTGGWSGNESIIGALQCNFLFWSLHHRSTRQGGHFMFCFHAVAEHDLCPRCKGAGLEPLPKRDRAHGG